MADREITTLLGNLHAEIIYLKAVAEVYSDHRQNVVESGEEAVRLMKELTSAVIKGLVDDPNAYQFAELKEEK